MSLALSPAGYKPNRPSALATLREVWAFTRRPPYRSAAAQMPMDEPSKGAVLVIPTLLRDDVQTSAMRGGLLQDGYAAFGWMLGRNMGPTARLLQGSQARLIALSDAHGPVNLVGLSMGGLFCRWLAFQHPERVRQVITVCSPFRAPLDSFFLPLRPALKLWRVPNLEAMGDDLDQPLPVPGTAIYSRTDGIVASESCRDRWHPDDCIALDTHHVTIATNPEVLAIIRDRLARPLPVVAGPEPRLDVSLSAVVSA